MSNPSDLPPTVAALPQVIAPTRSAGGLQPASPRSFFTAGAAAACRRIVIAVDLSCHSAYAVTWAVENHLRPGDAVLVLHVMSTSVPRVSSQHEAEAEAEAAARAREGDGDGVASKAEDLEAGVDRTTASKRKDQPDPPRSGVRSAASEVNDHPQPPRSRKEGVDWSAASKLKDQPDPARSRVDRSAASKLKDQPDPPRSRKADVDRSAASKGKDQPDPPRSREVRVHGITSKAGDLEAGVDSTTATRVKEQAEPLNHATGIRYMVHIIKDDNAKERICNEVRNLNTTLLIMASTGVGGARVEGNERVGAARKEGGNDGLGSVSDHCVRNCGCPVVVVRPNVSADPECLKSNGNSSIAVYSRRKKPTGKSDKTVTVYSRRRSKLKTETGLCAEDHGNEKGATVAVLKCSITAAFNQAVKENKLFVVYISGEDDASRRMEGSTFLDEHVAEVITRSCIFLQLKRGTNDELEFSSKYPQKSQPSLSIIGMDGSLLQNHEGYISPGDLKESIEKTWAELLLQAVKIALIYDERMMDHKPPNDDATYYERPQRLSAIYKTLEKDGTLNSCQVYKPELARLEDLLAAHSPSHVDEILSITEELQSDDEKTKNQAYFSKRELYCSPGTRRAILLAAGGAVKACSLVARQIHRTAFALIRPPGHHARRDNAGGFCFINNLAVGAKVLLNEFNMERVVALDWDIHHGDGTQDIFYADKRVLTFSLHRSGGFYPKSDKGEDKIGEGSGRGFNINVCWGNRPHVKDGDFYYVWKQILMPILREFAPEIILIACGYDAAVNDQLGKCDVTPKGYATLLSELNDLSMELNIGIVMFLEGGYNLVSIGDSASACIKVLSGDKSDIGDINKCQPRNSTLETVEKIKENLGPYWSALRPQED